MKDKLTNEMIKNLANRLGIEPALLKACLLYTSPSPRDTR